MMTIRRFKDHWQRTAQGERGAAALEFTLTLPVFLMLLLATISIGHGMVVRYLLNSAAYDAARSCTLQRTPTSSCANTVVKNKLGPATKWCGSLIVTGSVSKTVGFPAVDSMEVKVDCSYGGIIASTYLQSKGLWIKSIKAKAEMPF